MTSKASSSCSSLSSLAARHHHILSKIDELESRISTSCVSKRRRVAHLLEVTPTHRTSRLRLFLSHKCSTVSHNSTIATNNLDVDGGVVGGGGGVNETSFSNEHHVIPSNINANRQWTLCIEGKMLVGNLDHESANELDKGQSLSTDKSNYRGIAEKECDPPADPILFTHFFDKVCVEFQHGILVPSSSSSSSSSKKSKRGNNSHRGNNNGGDERPILLVWKREPDLAADNFPTSDAHAFRFNFEESDDEKNRRKHKSGSTNNKEEEEVECVTATVSLYRRLGPEKRYLIDEELATLIFPGFPITDEILSWNDHPQGNADDTPPPKQKRVRPNATGKKRNKKHKHEDLYSDEEDDDDNNPDDKSRYYKYRSVKVPRLVTMPEVTCALYQYLRSRHLFDSSDYSIVNNDELLAKLFGCHRMLFSAVRDLLFSRKLLMAGNDEPIVVRYVMTGTGKESDTLTPPSSLETTTKQHILNQDLTFDIDIDVPGLFHDRTRELLRRVKRREYEYTSSRTKALKMLASSRADEEILKSRIEQVVSGRGLTVNNIPIMSALAKAAPEGSEARNAAIIDARTAFLLDRVGFHKRMVGVYGDVVRLCQGRDVGGEESCGEDKVANKP